MGSMSDYCQVILSKVRDNRDRMKKVLFLFWKYLYTFVSHLLTDTFYLIIWLHSINASYSHQICYLIRELHWQRKIMQVFQANFLLIRTKGKFVSALVCIT
jgi:hypothetical protein